MSFLKAPKITPPLPPPATPTRADASLYEDSAPKANFSSMVNTGSIAGLTRKPNTRKSTLIGGA